MWSGALYTDDNDAYGNTDDDSDTDDNATHCISWVGQWQNQPNLQNQTAS